MFHLTSFVVACFLSAVCCVGQDPPVTSAESDSAIDYETRIRPLLNKYCADCHEPGAMQGLDFLSALTLTEVKTHRGMFADVAQQMNDRLMPPKNFDQPTDKERTLVTNWIKNSLDLKPADTQRIAQYVVAVYQDRKGHLWFGTMNKGVARYDGTNVEYFSKKDGLPSNAVPSFAEDKDGNFFVGTQAGVCQFDGKSFVSLGPAEGLPGPGTPSPESSASVSADRSGTIWVSVGQSIYRHDGKRFSKFAIPVALQNIESYSILKGDVSFQLEDSQGNLWFAIDGDGAYKFDGKSFAHFTKKDGLCSNNVTGIIEDKKGNFWFTCMQSYQPKMTGDGGLCRFDGNTFTTFAEVTGLSTNDLYSIMEARNGDIWIGATGVGAYRYDGKTFTLFDQADKPSRTRNFGVQDIFEAKNGTLWFGFSGGLFRFNGRSFFNVTADGPWRRLSSEMAEVIAGKMQSPTWIHAKAGAAFSALADGDYERAKEMLLSVQGDDPNEPAIREMTLNEIGYELIGKKQIDLALDVLKINTLLYPTSFNTFDSLGEAYRYNHDESSAIRNYQKSLELNPENEGAKKALLEISAARRYRSSLVAPDDWLEEVIICPPSFAPTMSITGLEHLRLPSDFRDPDSDWFISYLFAIELTKATELSEQSIGEQLLLYFRGLADGRSGTNGTRIDTSKFSIEPEKLNQTTGDREFSYVLAWREPFVNATPLKQKLRVKVITGKNEHGVLFICGSPKSYESEVWTKLLEIRSKFEAAPMDTDAK
ncbi:two-component regulator propeller domain-containing protein [Mariniblastus fucicola]|uniref:Two component regulator propeller n=1 Tax=Mariniblastus fucicola TaxID=980251 RepID=A0A5B9PLA4_9BACT|nr:two-component regulator propeller domain-containing protein [Mariniblastus fucicola]QEG23123.1 Two component regulator propeller [Mariniblastus fucicola]